VLATVALALSIGFYVSIVEEIKGFNVALMELENRTAGAAFPIQIVDSLNRLVTIHKPPERIVSIAPSITEILFAIGAESLVVGVDEFSNYPPEVGELVKAGRIEVVGGFSNPSLEKILALKPDLVVGVSGVQARFLITISQMGVTTLCLDAENIEDVINDILILGRVTGRLENAIRLAERLRGEIADISRLASSFTASRPKALFIVWINPIYAAGGKSWISSAIEIAGGANALKEINASWPSISWEKVLESNPDVIVFAEGAGGLQSAEQALEWLSSQPGGKSINAVARGRVYMVHSELNDIFSRPSPRVVYALWTLLYLLHPDLFDVEKPPADLYLENVIEAVKAIKPPVVAG